MGDNMFCGGRRDGIMITLPQTLSSPYITPPPSLATLHIINIFAIAATLALQRCAAAARCSACRRRQTAYMAGAWRQQHGVTAAAAAAAASFMPRTLAAMRSLFAAVWLHSFAYCAAAAATRRALLSRDAPASPGDTASRCRAAFQPGWRAAI
jgi:hypothetical protein